MSCCVQLISTLLRQVSCTTSPSMCLMVSVLCIQLLVNEVAMQAQGAFLPYGLGQIYATSVHKKKTSGKKKIPRRKGSQRVPQMKILFIYYLSTEEKKKVNGKTYIHYSSPGGRRHAWSSVVLWSLLPSITSGAKTRQAVLCNDNKMYSWLRYWTPHWHLILTSSWPPGTIQHPDLKIKETLKIKGRDDVYELFFFSDVGACLTR